jgi:hypothetical protein
MSGPFVSSQPLVTAVDLAPGNLASGVLINCTTGGTITLKMRDSTPLTITLPVGITYLPDFAIRGFTAGTAVAAVNALFRA